MSLLETACPHCGKSMVFSPIDSINTEERPEMIQKVRDGEALVSICGHCGKKSHMDYSFLYYQPSALFLVYYAADQEDYEKAWKMLTGQDREHRLDEEKLRGVKKRLVTSREALREKLMILDGGFDDRVIELMKGLAFMSLRCHSPELHPERVLFDMGADGNHYFRFEEKGKVIAAYAFETPMYREIETGVKDMLETLSRNQPVINAEWGAKALRASHQS